MRKKDFISALESLDIFNKKEEERSLAEFKQHVLAVAHIYPTKK